MVPRFVERLTEIVFQSAGEKEMTKRAMSDWYLLGVLADRIFLHYQAVRILIHFIGGLFTSL